MRIVDESGKPWWQSKTNWGLLVTAVAVFIPTKYKDMVGPTTDAVATLAGLLFAAYGRWRAGGVSVPLVGSSEK
jgi:hypothetical protein